mmetsp:Transcript_28416/g.43723  ORF Transcript_28416/g.43723 Transcript_28416/m.43723 type:complete len:141 (+) Transcript_28416:272-694(+)|eukprot:CAMPEP_0118698716 /NCGR_PEP_ID=MMETSP0800-20121206/15388_1 /TAXON_ID=210618 ORGANISM="Striatella unipunctata, Strain CCMP2910" /NCGR_SAMPLE_ID=MMETSP0800 /ASSEMBLY_ACC=CAM_ASM_000638 /LENGTH=140 /DNA_ID=CAMNT_0006598633 /DNA_START=221 /DNA_END=643 /DNA_ORIENTATION=-
MGRNYLQAKEFLERKFPDLEGNVTGAHHPGPTWIPLAAQLLSLLQVLGLVVAFMGDGVWRLVNVQAPPRWYYSLKENGMLVLMTLFFVLPSALQTFQATGAFEIFLNDAEIFSKLQSGRFPMAQDLTDPLTKAGLAVSSE